MSSPKDGTVGVNWDSVTIKRAEGELRVRHAKDANPVHRAILEGNLNLLETELVANTHTDSQLTVLSVEVIPKNENANSPSQRTVTLGPTLWQPLHLAVVVDDVCLVNRLIHHGADVVAKTEAFSIMTVLDLAAEFGAVNSIKALLDAGAPIDNPPTEDNGSPNRSTPLHFATQGGQGKVVEILLSSGADVNIRAPASGKENETGRSALHFALETCSFEIIKTLLESGCQSHVEDYVRASFNSLSGLTENLVTAIHLSSTRSEKILQLILDRGVSVHKKAGNGMTPIFFAAASNQPDCIHLLLDLGANVNHQDDDGTAALHHAAAGGHIPAAKALLSRGADVNIACPVFQSPLHITSSKDYCDLIRILIKAGADVNSTAGSQDEFMTPLYVAAEKTHVVAIKTLLDLKAKVDGNFAMNTPLFAALEQDSLPTIQELVERGASLTKENMMGQTLLQRALQSEDLDLVKYVIGAFKERGLSLDNFNSVGETTLHCLAQSEHPHSAEVIRILVREGADIDAQDTNSGGTPLHMAAHNGRKTTVEQFLREYAEVNMQDFAGSTPLHLTCAKGHVDIVKLLIKAGARLDLRDKDGSYVLHIAALCGHKMVVEALLDASMYADSTDRFNLTPLHLGSQNDQAGAMKVLLSGGANANTADYHGMGALHWACMRGCYATVTMLLANKAIVDLQDNDGVTPFHYTCHHGHKKIAQLLITYGASKSLKSTLDVLPIQFAKRRRHKHLYELVSETPLKEPTEESLLLSLFHTEGLGAVPNGDETKQIRELVEKFTRDLLSSVTTEDARFKGKLVLIGSAAEGMQVGEPDEFDFVWNLTELDDCIDLVMDDCPPGYAKIVVREPHRGIWEDFLTDEGCLLPQNLRVRLCDLIWDMIYEENFPIPRGLQCSLANLDEKEIIMQPTRPGLTINVKCMKHIYKEMKINIDVAPAVHFLNWSSRFSPIAEQAAQAKGFHAVSKILPPYLQFDGPDSACYWQLIFSLVERHKFHYSDEVRKATYMMAKMLLRHRARLALRTDGTSEEFVEEPEPVPEEPTPEEEKKDKKEEKSSAGSQGTKANSKSSKSSKSSSGSQKDSKGSTKSNSANSQEQPNAEAGTDEKIEQSSTNESPDTSDDKQNQEVNGDSTEPTNDETGDASETNNANDSSDQGQEGTEDPTNESNGTDGNNKDSAPSSKESEAEAEKQPEVEPEEEIIEKTISTYLLKTLVLWEMDRLPDDEEWTWELIPKRLMNIYTQLLECLMRGNMRSYFIPNQNLMTSYLYEEVEQLDQHHLPSTEYHIAKHRQCKEAQEVLQVLQMTITRKSTPEELVPDQ